MTYNKMNCLIIGSSGFLGSSIASAMKDANVKYSTLSHKNTSDSSSFFDIAKPVIQDSSTFTHAIYLSWSTIRTPDFQERSYFAAKYAADWAVRNNVRIIFISSMSAGVTAPRSNYGIFKKLAEKYYLSLGLEIVRPGTVLTKSVFAGSALVHLQNLSNFGKCILAIIKPIYLPIIYDDRFAKTLLQKIKNDPIIEAQDLVEKTITMQSILNLKPGYIPIKYIQFLLPLIPINVRDKLQTLIDLN